VARRAGKKDAAAETATKMIATAMKVVGSEALMP
jgi:hypothetical protein